MGVISDRGLEALLCPLTRYGGCSEEIGVRICLVVHVFGFGDCDVKGKRLM